MPPEIYPEIYHRELPPEVPCDYMARADEIREHAFAALEIYQQDQAYRFLLTWEGRLDKKQEKETHLSTVLGYVRGLEVAITKDDLIAMRRHEHPERYADSFSGCADKIRALPPMADEQMSFGMAQTVY